MKNKIRLIAVFVLFIISACWSTRPVEKTQVAEIPMAETVTASQPVIPTALPTRIPTASATPSPSKTPAPEPTPGGGGGALILTLNQRLYSSLYNLPGESNIFRAWPDGSNLQPITIGQERVANVLEAISPDGRKILYSAIPGDPIESSRNGRRGDLYAVGIDGSQPVRLNQPGVTVYPHSSHWLPDDRVVFIAVGAEGRAVYLVNLDGTGLTKLENTIAGLTGTSEILHFSEDGYAIYWVAGGWCPARGVCNEAYYYTRLDGSLHQQIWREVQGAANNIALSPDEKYIAYKTYFGQTLEDRQKNGCFVASIEGSEIKRIAGHGCNLPGENRRAAWSPEGNRLLLEDPDQEVSYQLYSATNGSTTPLPDHDYEPCRHAKWFADGQRLVLFECFTRKDDIYIPALIFEIKAHTVRQIPGSASCFATLSPDEKQLWLYNCSEAKDKPAIYAMVELESGIVNPIFEDLTFIDPRTGSYIWGWQPSAWVKEKVE